MNYMILKVGDEIIDLNKVPFALIFKTKQEAADVGNIISNIKNGDSKSDESILVGNGNWWMMHPDGKSKDVIDTWSTLSEEQRQLLEKSPFVLPYPRFEL